MEAFKCDNCGILLEGTPSDIEKWDSGRFIVGFAVAIKPSPKAESEDIEHMDMPKGDDFLSYLARKSMAPDDREKRADLCGPCIESVVFEAVQLKRLTPA
jgi:hypothetical protein